MRLARQAFATFCLILCTTVFFSSPQVVKAQDVQASYGDIMSQGLIFAEICDGPAPEPCTCRDTGQCQLSDMLQIFVNISVAILAISGSVALLMFFYGGFTWVTSMGNPKNVEKGKDIITRSVIGLAIIFGSYAFINFLLAAVTGKAPGASIEQTIDNSTGSTNSGDVLDSDVPNSP